MPRPARDYVCSSCGARAPRWTGRCANCGEWNSLVEEADRWAGSSARRGRPEGHTRSRALEPGSWLAPGPGEAGLCPAPLASIDPDRARAFPTGLGELDRVLAGGLVPGSVTLLGGEPGIGKSTLVLQAVSAVARAGGRALIIAAEESAEQVSRRARRLGPVPQAGFLISTGDLMAAIEAADQIHPDLLVVDSIQAISDPSIASPAGSPNQVRECAQLLAQYARATATATVLVGHVTKDGALAGPRTLEHLVDTVLSFEGDRHHALRALVATKHRYGPAGELGLFEMSEDGLASIEDPSAMLLADRRPDAPGTVALPVVEGRRPILVEVQALVAESHGGALRRVVQGIGAARLSLLLAVLEGCCDVPLASADVFVSTVGGIKVAEPATDLAVALAVVSSILGVPFPGDAVAFGEIGLTGELRQAGRPERRLAEAARLGFGRAIAPASTPEGPTGVRLERVGSLAEALSVLGWTDPRSRARSRSGIARAAPAIRLY